MHTGMYLDQRARIHQGDMCIRVYVQDCYNVIDVQEALRVANGITTISNLINPERFIAMSTSAVAASGIAALKESQLLSCQVCAPQGDP